MLFSSISFIYLFLPIVLCCYYLVPKRLKNFVLLLSSLLFYFFGEPIYTILLLVSSISDYLHSIFISSRFGKRSAKAALISALTINLLLLGFFKYADFFIGIVNSVLGTNIPLTHVPLPIGISFYTFQTMSYVIDVYRGRVKCTKNILDFVTFVSLFPQLIAGPIVRYSDVETELAERKIDLQDVSLGIRRFSVGLGKKVLIANAMGELCTAFASASETTVLFHWIYAVSFSLQIYFDFSGYSDMAIGLGRMLGFSFPENFDYPFTSRSITEFWRRWHMTMGGWFRDYVYFPMGGNRVSKGKWLRNILVVWFLTGLWHGASWNFIVWGVFFGVVLTLEKLVYGKLLERIARPFSHIYVMIIVLFSFVLFNGNGLSGALSDMGAMLGLSGIPFANAETIYYLRSYGVLIIVAILGSTNMFKQLFNRLSESKNLSKPLAIIEPLSVTVIVIVVTAYLVDGSFNPFLYFRF